MQPSPGRNRSPCPGTEQVSDILANTGRAAQPLKHQKVSLHRGGCRKREPEKRQDSAQGAPESPGRLRCSEHLGLVKTEARGLTSGCAVGLWWGRRGRGLQGKEIWEWMKSLEPLWVRGKPACGGSPYCWWSKARRAPRDKRWLWQRSRNKVPGIAEYLWLETS